VWPDIDSRTLSALFYFLSADKHKARDLLRNAHSAKYDIWFTYIIFKNICSKLGIKDMNSLYVLSEQARIPKVMPFGK
ncbi:3'-5' exonuclease, partial [Acinetobacter baumannii]